MATGTTVQITMPEMGESVTEGTILEWLKQVGDEVQADEGIVEVSTDKVDAEIPAPASGILTKILVEPDESVPTGAVLGEIQVDGATASPGNGGAPERERTEAAEEAAACNGSPTEAPSRDELVDVVVPEMGESVTEGTVLEWLKQVGDRVEVDDGLVEISTDKVDAELPAPVAGTLAEILFEPDETVSPGTVVCRIAPGEGAERTPGGEPAFDEAPPEPV